MTEDIQKIRQDAADKAEAEAMREKLIQPWHERMYKIGAMLADADYGFLMNGCVIHGLRGIVPDDFIDLHESHIRELAPNEPLCTTFNITFGPALTTTTAERLRRRVSAEIQASDTTGLASSCNFWSQLPEAMRPLEAQMQMCRIEEMAIQRLSEYTGWKVFNTVLGALDELMNLTMSFQLYERMAIYAPCTMKAYVENSHICGVTLDHWHLIAARCVAGDVPKICSGAEPAAIQDLVAWHLSD